MKDKRKNVAQSVRDRLRTVTVRLRLDYNLVLTRYVLERLLYDGVRVSALSFIGTARVTIRIDIGFGDAVTPSLEEQEYPALLDAPVPRLKTYPRETVIAEKLEAIVDIGTRTSRMKDYYDLVSMARLFAFDGQTISRAIRATFERRETELPDTVPPALSQDFAADMDAMERWNAFVRRTPLLIDPPDLAGVVEEITRFVMPPTIAAVSGKSFTRNWRPSVGWTAEVSEERT